MSVRPQTKDKPAAASFQWDDPFLLDDQLTIACREGAIRIVEVQRSGKAPMKAAEFLRGTPLKPGARFA